MSFLSVLQYFLQAGTGAVARSWQSKMRDMVCAYDYMTQTEINAAKSYSYLVDMTATLQNAINQAFALNSDLYIPAGGYLVTGLYLPGRVSGGTDDRGKAIRVYGEGTGEPFVISASRGTVILSNTANTPVLQDYLDTDPSSNGQVEIDHIRFVGNTNSNIPIVLLQSFYGLSSIHHCVFYQNGAGDGLTIGFSATTLVHHNYALNGDWNVVTKPGRTGKGFHYLPTYDGGLVTFTKNTSRGWSRAYRIGGGAGVPYSPTIRDCECSVVNNGIELLGTRKAVVNANYMEGLDGGFGVYNNGNYTTISDNLIFPGFSIGIDDRVTSNQGTVISGNIVGMGSVTPCVGIGVAGVFGRAVIGNTIARTIGTANQTGISVDVQSGKLTLEGNSFDPRQAWSGSGSSKVGYTSASDMYGIIIGQNANDDFPFLSLGAISLQDGALTNADVSGSTLTVPDGSYFVVTAASPVTVNSLDAGPRRNRLITLRTTNANMTIAKTGQNQISAAFTGPGTITLMVERLGGLSYAYEISRAV